MKLSEEILYEGYQWQPNARCIDSFDMSLIGQCHASDYYVDRIAALESELAEAKAVAEKRGERMRVLYEMLRNDEAIYDDCDVHDWFGYDGETK